MVVEIVFENKLFYYYYYYLAHLTRLGAQTCALCTHHSVSSWFTYYILVFAPVT